MAKSSFEVIIDDGGLDGAIKDVPFSVAWAGSRLFRRTLRDFKSQVKKQTGLTPGLKRLIGKSLFIKNVPFKPTFKAAKDQVRKGGLGSVVSDVAEFGPVTQAHEKGITINKTQLVLNKKFRRGLKQKLGKQDASRSPAGNLLKKLARDTRGIPSGAKGSLVSFKVKGRQTWFIVKTPAKGSRRAVLQHVASEVQSVTIKPRTNINSLWDARSSGIIAKHQTEALEVIERDWGRKRKSVKRKT